MKSIKEKVLKGERSLFQGASLDIEQVIFEDGESPLKESRDIHLRECMFKWKYPLWYAKNITAENCIWFEMARAGVWYTEHISVTDCAIEAPKNFRRCRDVTLKNVSFSNAAETLWNCDGVVLENVSAKGDYFAMNTSNIRADGLTLYGNYGFDGAKNIVVRNSRLLSKDAFWNTENIIVYDSFISGEYLGWNSRYLTFVNCTIESLQGLCFIDGLTLKNCTLLDTTFAFEYTSVNAEINSRVESILNPEGGTIKAASIGNLIMEKDRIDPTKTHIVCEDVETFSDHPDWIKE